MFYYFHHGFARYVTFYKFIFVQLEFAMHSYVTLCNVMLSTISVKTILSGEGFSPQ